jgi:hypothetical protein
MKGELMAKHISPMRLNESLVNEAEIIAGVMHRSTAEQIEYWSEMGKRLSSTLTTEQAIEFMSGKANIIVNIPSQPDIDIMALSNEVELDSISGALSKELLAKGQTLYAPSYDSSGTLEAIEPNGNRTKGNFRNGKFKPLRKVS